MHKTMAVINNTHTAHVRSLCKTYIKAQYDIDAGVTMGMIKAEDAFEVFWEEIHSEEYQQGDAQFKHNLFFFVDTVLPALLLMHTSQRLCEFWYYMAASLTLLPLFFVRNNVKYAPYLVEDAALWLYQVPPAIREQRVTFFTHQGQSQGAILEQYNKAMKHTIVRESEVAFKAGSGGLEQMSEMRRKLFELAGVKEKASHGHFDISYVMDVDAMVGLLEHGGAYKVVPNRTAKKIMTCDGSEQLVSAESNSCAMYAEGRKRLAEATGSVKREEKIAWKPAIPIIDRELKEGVVVAGEDDDRDGEEPVLEAAGGDA